jgi:hypothetical protein
MHALSSGEVYAFVPKYLQAEHCPSKDANDEGHGGIYFAKSCSNNGFSEYEAKTVGVCFTEMGAGKYHSIRKRRIVYMAQHLYLNHYIQIPPSSSGKEKVP